MAKQSYIFPNNAISVHSNPRSAGSIASPLKSHARAPFLSEPWTLLVAFSGCAGWILSAIHQLNAGGYIVAAVITILILWLTKAPIDFGRVRLRRFRRLFPVCFLILAILAFLGGALYGPNNYDGLAYRSPRVLHWLAEGQWTWIHTAWASINVRGCGYEWMSSPVFALTGTDRLLFLVSVISFLQLPGLIFSVFTRMGVSRRVAWNWMWIAPTGYCFVLQAGSIANDLFAVPLALAAFDFGLRANGDDRFKAHWNLWLCLLAGGAITAIKSSNILLLLGPGLLVLLGLSAVRHRKLLTCVFVAAAALCSFLPTAAMNRKFARDWSGMATMGISHEKQTLLSRFCGDFAIVLTHNLLPPVFPCSSWWDNKVVPRVIPKTMLVQMHAQDPAVLANRDIVGAPDLANEENTGIGLGICALLGLSLICGGRPDGRDRSRTGRVANWAAWVSFAGFLTMAVFTPGLARLLAPFYLPLFPVFLLGRRLSIFTRSPLWRGAAFVAFLVALALLVVTPSRPLFPAKALFAALEKRFPTSKTITRAARVYSVYSDRSDAFASVRKALPADVRKLGLITFDLPETSLWRPFGSRKILHILPEESAASLDAQGISYILVPETLVGGPVEFTRWAQKAGVQSVASFMLDLKASQPPICCHLVRRNAASPGVLVVQ